MKRITAIFLLLIMVVVGAHPVLAMHFCEGNLYSVGILDDSMSKSCCAAMKDMPQPETDSCCSAAQATTSQEDNHEAYKSHDDCCDIQKVQLSTDDYQHQDRQFNISHILPSLEHVWFTLNYMFNFVEPDTTVAIGQNFPPGGLNKQHIELLTYICIYRI